MSKIFYFSGTGNSIVTAKRIGEEIDAQLISVVSALKEDKTYNDNIIGLVVPVYCYDIPGIVKKLLEKIKFSKNTYIFTVLTCGGDEGKAINRVYQILQKKSSQLSYGNKVVLPSNFILGGASKNKRSVMYKKYEEDIKSIILDIKNKKINGEKFSREPSNLKIRFSWFIINKILKFKNKKVDEKECLDCRICINMCPVDNIEKKKGVISFDNRCEECSACIQWCPTKAITFGGRRPKGRSAYKHPEVSAIEIINQKNSKMDLKFESFFRK